MDVDGGKGEKGLEVKGNIGILKRRFGQAGSGGHTVELSTAEWLPS